MENTPNDFQKLVDEFLQNSSKDKPITKEQVSEFKSKANLFGIIPAKKESWINVSLINLRDEYYRKLHVTALIGYLFRVIGEFEDYIYDPVLEQQGVTRDIQQSLFKRQLEAFVRRHFDFNPDLHVRSAKAEETGDPSREGKFKEMRERMRSAKAEAKPAETSPSYSYAEMRKIAETVPDELARAKLLAYLAEVKETSCATFTAARLASEKVASSIKTLNQAMSLATASQSQEMAQFGSALALMFGNFKEAKMSQKEASELLERAPELISKYAEMWMRGPEMSPEDASVVLQRCEMQLNSAAKNLADSMQTIGALEEVRGVYNWIPPVNVFHHFDRYLSNHYEQLREAVHVLYNDKPDIEYAVCYHDTFNTEEDAKNWRIMHENKFITAVFGICNGKWTLMGPFKQNRDRIDFYNKNTEIIKRMFEQMESDQRLGADLMKKRVAIEKEKSIKANGLDDPQLEQYRQALGTIESLGAKKVLSKEEKAKLEEAYRVKESEEVPENAIQVDYFGTDSEGKFVKNKFYTQAEAPTYLADQIEEENRRRKGLPPGPKRPTATISDKENMPADTTDDSTTEDLVNFVKKELPIVSGEPSKKIISSKGEITTLDALKKKLPPKTK